MTVPESVARFLTTATVGIAGTRDRDLVPHVHRVSGWTVSPDGRSIDCFVAEPFAKDLLSSIQDNGEISLTVCEVPSHQTYQFKGRCVGSYPVGEAELELYQAYRDRAVGRIGELFGFSERIVRAWAPKPVVSVRFEVRDIFDQTPGPGAGRRVDSEESG